MTKQLDACKYCGDEITWHEGNGGQWIGAHPPRDWVTCGGSANPSALRHLPQDLDLPLSLDPDDLEKWLEA